MSFYHNFRYNMELSIENINLVQNEPVLWDGTRNASEEEKDLAWKRIADILGEPNGKIIRVLLRGLYGELANAVTPCVSVLDL